MKRLQSFAASALLALVALLPACASPDPAGNAPGADPSALPVLAAATEAGSNPAVPAAATSEAEVIPVDDARAPTPSDPVDISCKVDSDCAIKDVGSCCGYSPQCVNADAPTFPEQVKAQCASEGRMSVCGFPAISGCRCVQGRCAGVNDGSGDAGQVQ